MLEMQADAVEGRLLQLLLLRAEVGVAQVGKSQVLFPVRGSRGVLRRLATMEHEILDAAASRDADKVAIQEPEQLLGRSLLNRGIGGGHRAHGERVPSLF